MLPPHLILSRSWPAALALAWSAASCGDASGPAGPPSRVVTSIEVAAVAQPITWIGASRQLTATVRDQDGAAMAGVSVSWSSSEIGVAAVHSSSGVVTAAGNGTTTITAEADGVTGQVTISVQQAVASIAVTPGLDTLLAAGLSRTYTAAAVDSGNTAVAGAAIRWASSNTAVAIIDSLSGTAQSAGHGTATITARVGTIAANATLVVRTVGSVEVTPASQTLNWIGATRPFAAAVRDAGGVVMAGAAVTWSSTQPDVAAVDQATGIATAAANGSTSIVATAGVVSGNTTLTVQQAVTSIAVTPRLDTLLAAGLSRTYTATAVDSGNTAVAGAAIRWSSSNTAVATIDSLTGAAFTARAGTVTISARSGAATGTATLIVRDGTLVGGRVLLTDYGNVHDNEYLIDGDFVIWWHGTQDWAVDAQEIMEWVQVVRGDALQLGLHHPPSVARGVYINIYLHEPGPGNDNYPDGWGAGVGTDGNNLPFLSVGSAQRNDELIFRHEVFHLYQYTGTRQSPGFAYGGDAQWYTETTATWYSTLTLAADANSQQGAATVLANPQLALWHSWNNAPAGDPVNWNRTTRQYALSTFLDYLTHQGVHDSVIVSGYVNPITQSPQEYLYDRIGGFGALLADFAAASTPDMPYLTRPQWTAALQALATYGDPLDRHEYVVQLTDAGTGGEFVQPPAAVLPRGWGWNVFRVTSTQAASWRFEVDGDSAGSAGAAAVFHARLLTVTDGARSVRTVPLTGALDGHLDETTTAAPTEMYLIVAATPVHFTGHQTYAYRVRIDRN